MTLNIEKSLYRNGLPILVTLISFWHFTVVRQQPLTPSIAFTSILGDYTVRFVVVFWLILPFSVVFAEMRFALSALPETFINMLQVSFLFSPASYFSRFSSFVQSFVSLRRIDKYLNGAEVNAVPPLSQQSKTVAFQSCTATWPQNRNASSLAPSAAATPKHKFVLVDLSLGFPQGELSLICGKLGSGKTLLLLGKRLSPFQSLR